MLAAGPNRKVFAGATDVIPQIRSGRPEPEALVDLKKIARLTAVTKTTTGWTIGAATPTARLTENAEFSAAFPGLTEAAGLIGSDQIQNRSSLGGNLCNASPAADSVPAMIVNGARAVDRRRPGGTRTVPGRARSPPGPGKTSLAPGEFIVEFELDDRRASTADAYLRLIPRTEMDIAVVGAGARVTLDATARCTRASASRSARSPRPWCGCPTPRRRLVGDAHRRRRARRGGRRGSAGVQPDRRQARHDRVPPPGGRRARQAGRRASPPSEPPARDERST